MLQVTETEGVEPKECRHIPKPRNNMEISAGGICGNPLISFTFYFGGLFGFLSKALKYDGFALIVAVHLSLTSQGVHMHSLSYQKPYTLLALGIPFWSKSGIQ